MSDWIQTYTGRKFYPTHPRAADVHILDIAHHLSLRCRFSGGCREFYSVAQHSVLVSQMVPEQDALWGLLHDAAEAYTGDLIRPLKHRPELRPFLEVEASIETVIAEAYDVPLGHSAIKEADVWVLTHIEVEARKSWDSNAMDDKQKFLIEAHDLGINGRHA